MGAEQLTEVFQQTDFYGEICYFDQYCGDFLIQEGVQTPTTIGFGLGISNDGDIFANYCKAPIFCNGVQM